MSTLARSSALAGWCRGVLRCESGKASGEMAGHQHRRAFGAGFILSQTEMGAHNRCHILFLVRGGRVVRRSGSNWQHVLGRAHRPPGQDPTQIGELRRKAAVEGDELNFARAKFSHWRADTAVWDGNCHFRLGLGASLLAVRGSVFLRLLLVDTVRGWCSKDSASLLIFSARRFRKSW